MQEHIQGETRGVDPGVDRRGSQRDTAPGSSEPLYLSPNGLLAKKQQQQPNNGGGVSGFDCQGARVCAMSVSELFPDWTVEDVTSR